MPHVYHHHHGDSSDRALIIAVALNLVLTLVEATAGVLAGSLALVADAVHNFGDCASLVVALVARRIARRPSDLRRTFGYRRAETIGALLNLTALAIVGVYLAYEAVVRLLQPVAIDGWVVVTVAAVALVIDVATAWLLYAGSRSNLNLHAAFLHNVGDALSSVGVIIAGAGVLLYRATWLDPVVTLAIAGYLVWQSIPLIARSIHILLGSVPPDIELGELIADVEKIDGVAGVHHVHVWEMDDDHRALEAHIVVAECKLSDWAFIKSAVKERLLIRYRIQHSTLEFETADEASCAACPSEAGR
jgi:cobalt-zinc-cadmium efflux system protein